MGQNQEGVVPVGLNKEIYPTTEKETYDVLVERIDNSRKNGPPLNPSDLVGYAFLVVGQRSTDTAPRLVLQKQLKEYREIAHSSWTRVYGDGELGEVDKKIVSLILGETLSTVKQNQLSNHYIEQSPLESEQKDQAYEEGLYLLIENKRLEYAIKQLGFEPDLLLDYLSNKKQKRDGGCSYLVPDDIDLSAIGDIKEATYLPSGVKRDPEVIITQQGGLPQKPVEKQFDTNNRWVTLHNTVATVAEKINAHPGEFSNIEEEVKTIVTELINRMSHDSLRMAKDVKGKNRKEFSLRQALAEIANEGILIKGRDVDQRKLANLRLAWEKWGKTDEVKSSEQLLACQKQFTEIIDSLS